MWILAFLASLAGLGRTTRVLIVASIPVSIIAQTLNRALEMPGETKSTTVGFLALLAIVAACGDTLSTRRLRVSTGVLGAAWGAVIAISSAVQVLTKGAQRGGPDLYLGTLSMWLDVAAPIGVLAALILWGARRSQWAAATLIVAVPIAALLVFGWQHQAAIMLELSLAVGVIAIIALVVGLLRAAGIRIRITRV